MTGEVEADDAWLITRASVRGTSHVDSGKPCQDYCDVRMSRDGRWLVAAVCDGAGSAARSDEGAQLVAQSITAGLIKDIAEVERLGPGVWLKDRVHAILLEVRRQLRAASADIREFHCTLVGAFVGPSGGFFFHVGDGAGVASRVIVRREELPVEPAAASGEQGTEGSPAIDTQVAAPTEDRLYLWEDLVISLPENGEMANETFFVTQDSWDRHLRLRRIPGNADLIMLMSDGGMEYVLPFERINPPWINPVVRQLMRTEEDDVRDSLVNGYLDDPETYFVTHDDKSLFVAMRRRTLAHNNLPLSMEVPPSSAPMEAAPADHAANAVPESPPKASSRESPTRTSPMTRQTPILPIAKRPAASAFLPLALSSAALALSLVAAGLSLWAALRPAVVVTSPPVMTGGSTKPVETPVQQRVPQAGPPATDQKAPVEGTQAPAAGPQPGTRP